MQLPPATILNQVAARTDMTHQSITALFQMPQATLDKFLADQYAALLKAGHDPIVAQAYQALEPLLMENEAISQFVVTMDDLSLRAVLPEILTRAEAVELADRDLFLTDEQKVALMALLH